jgi:membrane-associated phospholipid phosphatase
LLYFAFLVVFLILWAVFYATLPALQRSSALTARFLAVRFHPYLPIAALLIIGGAIAAWAGDQFLDLAEALHANSPRMQDFDVLSHAWAISKRTAADTSFFALMSNIGSPVGMMGLAVLAAIVLAIQKKWRWLIYLAVTAGGGALLNMELKRFFARARPAVAEMIRQAHGYSFPSGHAMGSTVVLGALSYLAFRTAVGWKWKAACLAFAWTLILSIALSRVYLGVHWISDVAAGIVAGTVWVAATTISYETVRRYRFVKRSSMRDGARGA